MLKIRQHTQEWRRNHSTENYSLFTGLLSIYAYRQVLLLLDERMSEND